MVDLSKLDKKALGKYFDHSVLPKNTTEADIRSGCREAVAYNCAAFYSATPFWTPIVAEELSGTDILIGTGLDFPFGASSAVVKAFETEQAVKAGCTSLDLVMNVGALKDKKYEVIKDELDSFKKAAQGNLTKCIMEVCYLTDEEIVTACKMISEAGIHYAKTSTGQFEGPSMEQFLIMKKTLEGTDCKLKVAGVKFPRPQNAYAFLLAGADLIGTRAAVQIIDALDQMREIGLVPPYKG
ncbi:deoxyribose-phosphate aldolase [Acetobacterium malicum]|uniref:Deoxyribose-phosphate aldolase n=1 Tax=Acetobacterium malicum TaxID=52692 RepID=A0ABR6YXS6_9FIRM|nr:deoxyribose-phosphate aldolase [Acetobacterium malicum]MBC3900020.1 deoxyribose-phosphate aldolase [Acetobacterium malicum]